MQVVSPANRAPTTHAATITAYANRPYVFSLTDFPYSDAANRNPSAISAVILVSLPASGSLTLNGAAVAAGQAISAAAIRAGALVYAPAAHAVEVAHFTFEVRDSGGTANGRNDTSAAATATVRVLARETFADGSFEITRLGAAGAGYAYYTVLDSASGRALSIQYSNGESAVFNYGAGGALHDVAYAGVVGAAYTAYDVV